MNNFAERVMSEAEVKNELDRVTQAMKDEQLPGGVDRKLYFPFPETISSDDRTAIVRLKELVNRFAGGKYPNHKVKRIREFNAIVDSIFAQEMTLKDTKSYKTIYWGLLPPNIQDRVVTNTGANNEEVRNRMSYQQLMYYVGREALSAAERAKYSLILTKMTEGHTDYRQGHEEKLNELAERVVNIVEEVSQRAVQGFTRGDKYTTLTAIRMLTLSIPLHDNIHPLLTDWSTLKELQEYLNECALQIIQYKGRATPEEISQLQTMRTVEQGAIVDPYVYKAGSATLPGSQVPMNVEAIEMKPSQCKKCLAEGHRAKNCKKKVEKCSKCHLRHWACDSCSSARERRKTVTCMKCKQNGHYQNECANKQVEELIDAEDWLAGAFLVEELSVNNPETTIQLTANRDNFSPTLTGFRGNNPYISEHRSQQIPEVNVISTEFVLEPFPALPPAVPEGQEPQESPQSEAVQERKAKPKKTCKARKYLRRHHSTVWRTKGTRPRPSGTPYPPPPSQLSPSTAEETAPDEKKVNSECSAAKCPNVVVQLLVLLSWGIFSGIFGFVLGSSAAGAAAPPLFPPPFAPNAISHSISAWGCTKPLQMQHFLPREEKADVLKLMEGVGKGKFAANLPNYEPAAWMNAETKGKVRVRGQQIVKFLVVDAVKEKYFGQVIAWPDHSSGDSGEDPRPESDEGPAGKSVNGHKFSENLGNFQPNLLQDSRRGRLSTGAHINRVEVCVTPLKPHETVSKGGYHKVRGNHTQEQCILGGTQLKFIPMSGYLGQLEVTGQIGGNLALLYLGLSLLASVYQRGIRLWRRLRWNPVKVQEIALQEFPSQA